MTIILDQRSLVEYESLKRTLALPSELLGIGIFGIDSTACFSSTTFSSWPSSSSYSKFLLCCSSAADSASDPSRVTSADADCAGELLLN